jgi:hypothetical protein
VITIPLKNSSVHPSRNLRTNGGAIEIIGDFSVHAELVEAFLGFLGESIGSSDPCDFLRQFGTRRKKG